MAQPREAIADVLEHHWRAVAVLYIVAVDKGVNQKAVRIGDDMALSSFHFLARIIAAYAAAFGGFDALAVDHSSAGRAFAALRYPCILDQVMVDPLPCAIVAPAVKIMLHSRCWRKARRHHPPRQASAEHIE